MKIRKYFIIALYLLALQPGLLKAQEPRSAISVDLLLPALSPVSRLAGEEMAFLPLNVKYQHLLTEHQVLMLKMGLAYSWDSDESITDIYPMLALEWHPFKSGLEGFYFGPSLFFNYSNYTYSRSTASDDLDHSYWYAAGGNIGYGFVLRSHLIIDLMFGLGYGYFKEIDVNSTVTSDFKVDETIGGVFLGYSF